MKLLLDILQGIGLAVGRGRPAVPARARRRRARERRRRRRLRRHRLRLPRDAGLPARRRDRRWSSRSCSRARRDTPAGAAALGGHRRSASGALLFAATLDDRNAVWWPGADRRRAVRRAGDAAVRDALRCARARGSTRGGGRAAALRRGASPLVLAGARRSSSRRSRSSRVGFFVWLLRRRAPPRGREVRGPAHPAVTPAPPKLVLAVIDAHEAGDARARGRDRPRAGAGGGHGARHLRRRVRRGVPVGHAGLRGVDRHRRAARTRHRDPVDELVPPRARSATSSTARASAPRGAFGIASQLTDTIYNMNAEHLSRGRADGVRVARRRRRAHGRHDVPDVPRPPRARGLARHGADAARLDGLRAARSWARRSSSTPTSSPAARPAAARSSACPGVRDQHAGCVGAYLVEHDLFDFLLLSLPDNDTHSHKHGPHAQVDVDRRTPTASSSA